MKPERVSLEDVAAWDNLIRASHRATMGKRFRCEVDSFLQHLHTNIRQLRTDILEGTVAVREAHTFRIRDPKPRMIHAPCFRERVLHHGLMGHVGPVLGRSLVDDSFACRTGKGSLAAVKRCQHHTQRFPWFAKMDIRKYFASIEHTNLMQQLERRFRDDRLLQLIFRIIDSHHTTPSRGLPIGALTSQCFANFYLGRLDRFLLDDCRVRGLVRYMDDFVFWQDSRREITETEQAVHHFLNDELGLQAKSAATINRSRSGVTLCGYRVFPGTIRVAASRRKRFRFIRDKWEQAWLNGQISDFQLQRGYAAAAAIIQHADSRNWLRTVAKKLTTWHDLV